MSTTVELSSDKRRTMVLHITWRELSGLAEKLHGLGWPMLNDDDHDRGIEDCWRYSHAIAEWGNLLAVVRGADTERVEVPLSRDELRDRVGEYIKGIWENELHEAELEEMQDLLDHGAEAKAFLDSLGGPIAREVPA